MTTRSEYWEGRERKGLWITDPMFNTLRLLVELVLPALGTLYFSLAELWALPEPYKVVGTIVAVTTFLGVCLKLLRHNYEKSEAKYDGEFVVNETDPMKDVFRLEVGTPFGQITNQDELRLKVRRDDP